ncbi:MULTISPECIES: hypothetical protein [Bacillus]|uniref:hypothetical protein n=1 Tax=Bacillus TaxID=1386 RepID=UPI00098A7129|nr:hypothetical protein [Bacillus sonorensis]
MMKIIQLIRGDMKQICRDSMLAFYGLAPLLLIIVIRFGEPVAAKMTGVDAAVCHRLVISFAMLLIPLILGIMSGFILLDERDDNLIQYFAVTPLSKRGYLMIRLAFPMLVTLCYGMILLLWESGHPLHLFFALSMITLEAPLYTLLLAAYASNKVEGLALMKGFSLMAFTPAFAFFIPEPWQFFGIITPTYWTANTYLAGSHVLLFGGLGIVFHLLMLYGLYRRFILKTDH